MYRRALLSVCFLGFAGCQAGAPADPTPTAEPPSWLARALGLRAGTAARTQERIVAGAGGGTLIDRGNVPGQVIVKFRSTGPRAVTECSQRWLAEGRSFAAATADGSDSLDRLHQEAGVLRARSFLPERAGLSTAAARQREQGRLGAVTARLTAQGVRTTPAALPDLTNVYVLDTTRADVEELARRYRQDPHVEYAQPNYTAQAWFAPTDPYYASTGSWGQAEADLWGLKRIQAGTAWDTSQGEGVVIAVVDSGLDATHPDIAGNVFTHAGEIAGNGIDDDGNGFIDDDHGWDFAAGDRDPTDGFGHGTHVAGTIAASANDGGVIGVAPRAKIMALRGLDDQGSGTADNLAAAIIYAARNGARVVNNSWGCGGGCTSNPLVEDAVRLAHGLGTTVVFAAGNNTADVQGYSPQNQPQPIVVAATDPTDQPTSFSNFGMVDVGAPGGGQDVAPPAAEPSRNILSLRSAVCDSRMCDPSLLVGTGYVRQAGTSMAAPHVAGAAALILAQHPTYTPEQVRQVLRQSSTDAGPLGPDPGVGYGRIDLTAALAQPAPLEALITAPVVVAAGSTQVNVTGIARGTGFASWQLDRGGGKYPTSWTPIQSSTTPVDDGLLFTWNLAGVPDGVQTLRLRVTGPGGRVYEDRQEVTIDQLIITEPSPTLMPFYRPGDAIAIRGTVAPANLHHYEIWIQQSDGSILPNPQVTLTGGGSSPVRDGLLGTWNTTGVSTASYRIFVTAHLTAGDALEESVLVAVDSHLRAGWPQALGLVFNSLGRASMMDMMTVADVNGDGRAEMLIGYGKTIRVLNDAGQNLPGWPQSVDWNGAGIIQKSPAVGDLTGDGIPEIVGGTNAGRLFAFQADGTPLPGWPRSAGSTFLSVAIADLDGNHTNEIVATDWNGVVRVLRADGSPLPGWPRGLVGGGTYTTMAPPSIADLDGDGKKEVVAMFKSAPSRLYALSSDGQILPGWPREINPTAELGSFPTSDPALVDLDGDGDLEILTGNNVGQLLAFHHGGGLVAGWPKFLIDAQVNTPAIGDLDGDGRPEIVVGTGTYANGDIATNRIYAFDTGGQLLPGWPVLSDLPIGGTYFGFGAPMIADLDGDGRADVVASSDISAANTVLHAFRWDGTKVAEFPKPARNHGGNVANTAAVADLDGDGQLEMCWADLDANLYLWDLPVAASLPKPWPMWRANPAQTGASPPRSSPATTLLSDDFEDGNFAGWTVHSGLWTVIPDNDGGKVFRQANEGGNMRASVGQATWTDQAVEARIKPTSWNGIDRFVMLMARFQDANNYYYVTLRSSGKLELKKLVAGSATTLASKAFPVQTNTWYRVKLSVIGTSLKAYVDGNLELSATDAQFASGKAAVGSYYAAANFDDVRVTRPGIPMPLAAGNPSPADGATAVAASKTPSFTAGAGATSHDVYFGTSNPPPFRANQAGTTYNPGALVPGTVYYWRVDERNAAGVTPGPIWKFTTLATLLSDNFESGSASQWTVHSGTWAVVTDGTKVYKQSNTSNNTRASAGSAAWTDQIVQAKVKVLSWNGTDRFVAVLARFRDPNNYYYVTLRSSGKVELKKLVNGTAVSLGTATMSVSTGTWYTVKLEVLGTSLRAYVNGTLRAEATDEQHPSGKVGLKTYFGSAEFDDVLVTR